MKTTFKAALVLSEARRKDLTYIQKVVKNKIDRVTVELEGSESGVLTKLAARFDRLGQAITKMAEKQEEIKGTLKDRVTDLFDAEDVILTRVAETASFTLTLSKMIAGKDLDSKKIVDYEKIANELATLIPTELEAQVKAVYDKYTETRIEQDRLPAIRVKKKDLDESATTDDEEFEWGPAELKQQESFFKKISGWFERLKRSVASWAVKYDQKLNNLKRAANVPVTESVDLREFLSDEKFQRWRHGVLVNYQQAEFTREGIYQVAKFRGKIVGKFNTETQEPEEGSIK